MVLLRVFLMLSTFFCSSILDDTVNETVDEDNDDVLIVDDDSPMNTIPDSK
jgi:hypothetical protein